MTDPTIGRPAENQISTARYLLTLFIAQIDEYEAMNREQRRTPRGKELEARIDALRQGRATQEARIAELEQETDS